MPAVIRLTRIGRKKSPAYRIVVADSRRARDGRVIEILGHYQPLMETPAVEIDEEKALKWLMVGAKPSDTVRSIFRKRRILEKFHKMRKPEKPQTSA